MFQNDPKWVEAKKATNSSDWAEVLSYYRELGGSCVFIYALLDREKKQILDLSETNDVIVLTQEGIEIEERQRVLESRKHFSYSEDPLKIDETYSIFGHTFPVYKEY